MIGFTLPLLLAALGPGAPDVRGDSGCPSPEEVARRLRPLLPADGELPPGAWLEIAEPVPAGGAAASVAAVEIEVRLMTGTPPRVLGARRLSVPRSCEEAAQAVAVVAATWTASYLSPSPLGFGESPPRAPVAPIAQATDAETPSQSPLASSRAAVAGEVRAGGPAAGRNPLSFEVGAELGLAAATAGSAAPFLRAEIGVRGPSAFGARLLVMAADTRTIDLGSGQVAWRRLMAGAGIARSWGTPAAHLQIGGDILAGATFIEGVGFAQNAGTASFDAGAGPWVRAGARLAAAPVTVWVGAQVLAWAREQQVRVDGVASRDSLPRLDLLLGAGLTWAPLEPKSSPALKQ